MKKLTALLLAAVMVLALAACTKGSKGGGKPTESTATTEATKGPIKIESDDPIFKRDSYTVSPEDAMTQNGTQIATVGGQHLTNGQLQVYYWMNVYNFLNANSYYLSYYGLDYTKPLDEQDCPGTAGTWQHYFLAGALDSWHTYQAMDLEAKETGVAIDEKLQEELDGLRTDLEKSAQEKKFDSVDAMLQSDIAPGITYADYEAYLKVYYSGFSYYNEMVKKIEVTDMMIGEYFAKNEATLKQNGITKDSGDIFNVRHILITPEGGAKDEQGNIHYSETEWEACRVKAQKLLDEWLAGDATEETFAEFANKNSTDPGSNNNGGLYDGLNKDTNFVKEFKDWYLAEGRKVGDYGLVKTSYGYHIMYFSGTEAQWIHECRKGVKNEESNKIVKAATTKYPITTDYTIMALGKKDIASDK